MGDISLCHGFSREEYFKRGSILNILPPPINCAFFLRIPAKNPESPAYSIGGVARHDSFLLPLGLLKYSFFVI
jgi:hypothetical protein